MKERTGGSLFLRTSLLVVLVTLVLHSVARAANVRVYFGTFTQGEGQGIFQSELDLETGMLSPPTLAGEARRPGFIAVHPNGNALYSVGERVDHPGKDADSVCAFSIDPTSGKLTALNKQPGGGNEPCHISMDAAGAWLFSAQYGGGSCSVYPTAQDGSLKPRSSFQQHIGASEVDVKRQMAPHAHSINLNPSGRYAVVTDLGKDQLMLYRFDPKSGTLTPNDPAFVATEPGGGPRHFDFHPSGTFAYVNLEMTSRVTAFSFDDTTGTLTPIQTLSTLPDAYEGKSSGAELRVSPDGKFLYTSNRGHDSIAIFSINQTTGQLTAVGHEPTQGRVPRHFNIDPSGRFLLAANQGSNSVSAFRIDRASGRLSFTGSTVHVPKPVCVAFPPKP